MPPCRIVAEMPFRSTASNTAVRPSTRAPRCCRRGSGDATSAIATRSSRFCHTDASREKNSRVVGFTVVGSR